MRVDKVVSNTGDQIAVYEDMWTKKNLKVTQDWYGAKSDNRDAPVANNERGKISWGRGLKGREERVCKSQKKNQVK